MNDTNEYRRQIEAVLQATVIHSPTTYSWFGKHSWPLSQRVKQALSPQTARRYLLFTLQHRLYNDFYCPGFPRAVEESAATTVAPGMKLLTEALAEANTGKGYWEAGWLVQRNEDERVVVYGGDMTLWVRPDDCLVPVHGQILPGTPVSLHFPKDLPNISPGFYMARGNRGLMAEDENTQSLVRLYWNLAAEGAVRLMHTATTLLNQANLAFTLKVLSNPQHFTRCDAAVLYIQKRDYDTVANILPTLYAAVEANLRKNTPAFTKRLAAGLGLAEDIASTESFGEHRCRLLAEGMIRAYEQKKHSVEERLQVVEECFAEAGIRLESPFLGPGSNDSYHFLTPHPQIVSGGHQKDSSSHLTQDRQLSPDSVPQATVDAAAFLRTAEQIGRQIVEEAIWHEQQCNWLGAGLQTYSPYSSMQGFFRPTTYRALGPDMYDGTSGIALFLAELAAITGDSTTQRTAFGAIQQALAHVDSLPPDNRLGLYTGWTGIALAVARIGTLFGKKELLSRARALLLRLQSEKPPQYEFDFIYGNAGAIIALVALRYMLDDPSLLDFAVQLGDELLNTAEKNDAGCSWRSLNFPSWYNLTGLSHGTAGAAYALIELFQATGETTYRSTAEAAFDYERYWFDAQVGNWPDLRDDPFQKNRSTRKKQTHSFTSYWCHGAAGIALSRLHAYQVLQDERYKAEAIIALQTTRKALQAALYSGIDNFSLCHGFAGNAEVLLEGERTLGPEWADSDSLALTVANFGIATYANKQRQWPCGIQGGTTPGLLLGLSGIGYFFLRLHQPTLPSILLPSTAIGNRNVL